MARERLWLFVVVLPLLLAVTSPLGGSQTSATPTLVKADEATQVWVSDVYGELPLSFEPNHGQTNDQVKFLSRGREGYNLFLTSNEAVIVLSRPVARFPRLQAIVRIELLLAKFGAEVSGLEELPGKSNYFVGNDRQQWHTNIPTYAKVQYQGVYPGVDLIFYGNQRQLEYDFIVAPGANPEAFQLAFDGLDRLALDAQGNLTRWVPLMQRAQGAVGEVIQHAPSHISGGGWR